jgi:hypothetical protein
VMEVVEAAFGGGGSISAWEDCILSRMRLPIR